MKITYFKNPGDFRKWLSKNHDRQHELMVGFYKVGSGRPSITWPESVDEALCYGWIDGIRRRIDDESYSIRFTPRKPTSTWSAVNIRRVAELKEKGLMQPAGLAAFERRKENRSGIYAYEQRTADLPAEYEKQMKKNKPAWNYFTAQPASYRKAANWWVVSAKRDETRQKRLRELIEYSGKQEHIPQFLRLKK
jgi:uncharacterized protein YdeI (YjbR/CyaY-like superfamily)